jgi:hypothetical protein
MSEGAVSGDRKQQARDNIASRRQSGLEPRPEDLRDAGLDERHESKPRRPRKESTEGQR